MCVAREQRELGAQSSASRRLALACDDLFARVLRRHRAVTDHEVAERWEAPFRGLEFSRQLALSRQHFRHPVLVRVEKDARLKRVIRQVIGSAPSHVDNPCSVFGRHARELARSLPAATVRASDLDPTWERLFSSWQRLRHCPDPPNYSFRVQSVYDSTEESMPDLVAVFGACGSLADGVLERAARLRSRYVVVRACCHENLGMNTELSTWKCSLWHLGHRLKNVAFRAQQRRGGLYWSSRFAVDTYPRSRRVRQALAAKDILGLARHAVDCAGCRLLIDLDRLCYLDEHGYELLGYHQGMIVAERLEPAKLAQRGRP